MCVLILLVLYILYFSLSVLLFLTVHETNKRIYVHIHTANACISAAFFEMHDRAVANTSTAMSSDDTVTSIIKVWLQKNWCKGVIIRFNFQLEMLQSNSPPTDNEKSTLFSFVWSVSTVISFANKASLPPCWSLATDRTLLSIRTSLAMLTPLAGKQEIATVNVYVYILHQHTSAYDNLIKEHISFTETF